MTKRNSRTARARAHRAFTATQAYQTIERVEPPAVDLSKQWYLITTAPRAEMKAANKLEAAGCTVFLPQQRKISVTSRRRCETLTATFPRYVFVSDIPPGLDVKQIEGVSDAVRYPDGRWAPVPSRAIAFVLEYQRGTALPVEVKKPYQPGAKVTVIDGPFMSFQATVVDLVGLDAADVLLNIFGRQTRAQLHLAQIKAA